MGIFDLFCFILILFFLGLMVLQQNPLVSVFSFIFMTLFFAVFLFKFGYYFFSICILLIYIGAIAILFLFAVLSFSDDTSDYLLITRQNYNTFANRYNSNSSIESYLFWISVRKKIKDICKFAYLYFLVKVVIVYSLDIIQLLQSSIILTKQHSIVFIELGNIQTTLIDIHYLGIVLYNTSTFTLFFIFSAVLLLVVLIGSSTVLSQLQE